MLQVTIQDPTCKRIACAERVVHLDPEWGRWYDLSLACIHDSSFFIFRNNQGFRSRFEHRPNRLIRIASHASV